MDDVIEQWAKGLIGMSELCIKLLCEHGVMLVTISIHDDNEVAYTWYTQTYDSDGETVTSDTASFSFTFE